MKYCSKLILALFLFSNFSFSQFYEEDEISPYIIEFMEIADEFAKQNDPENKIYKIFTDAEIEHIADLYFKCYNDDPVGFQKYVAEKHKEWEKAPYEIGMKSMKIRMRPWMKVYALRNRIANEYGVPFTEIIGCPVFIRAKFDSAYQSSSYLPELKSKWHYTNFVFTIEEVLKGNKFFKCGNKSTISFSPNVEAPSPKFEEDKSYLVPVTTWIDSPDYDGKMYFGPLREYYDSWVMGKPPKTFPIENEVIKECEYFGISDTSWVDFKKFFKEKYLIFD